MNCGNRSSGDGKNGTPDEERKVWAVWRGKGGGDSTAMATTAEEALVCGGFGESRTPGAKGGEHGLGGGAR